MDNIKYLIIMWAAALIFIIVGLSIMKKEKPVRLFIGSGISLDKITDVKAYNRTIGKMWCFSAIPLGIAGVIVVCFPAAAIIIFGVTCLAAVGCTVWCYHKIESKYIK